MMLLLSSHSLQQNAAPVSGTSPPKRNTWLTGENGGASEKIGKTPITDSLRTDFLHNGKSLHSGYITERNIA